LGNFAKVNEIQKTTTMKSKSIIRILAGIVLLAGLGYIGLQLYIKSINMETTQPAPETVVSGEQIAAESGKIINTLDHLLGSYTVVKEKSSLFFEVGGQTAATGKFTEFDVDLTQDESSSSLAVTIQAVSINTSNKMRDEHLREPDFFDVEKYPTITFSSKEIILGDTSLLAKGSLTFMGKTENIHIPFDYKGAVAGAENAEYFEGKFQFDRVKMGMASSTTIDDLVTVKFFVELKK
jgi:polyisoprenoid-binding protein YceI